MYVTDGGVEVSDEANFFHPYESLSLAFSAADTVASVRADHACASEVIGILIRPSGHELE